MGVITRESQYAAILGHSARMGPMASEAWERDPKHLLFTLARYKFVAKMLAGRKRVLEVGCGDAFATRIVRQTVGSLIAIDFDPVMIDAARTVQSSAWPVELRTHDLLADGPVDEPDGFDGAYALDVLEHVPHSGEVSFLSELIASLTSHAVLIIGMPSIESQRYASAISRAGHVNCKTGPELAELMGRWFPTVLSFSMNDEVVHTGFHGMAHYLFAVGIR